MYQLKNSIASCVSEIKERDGVITITGIEASWIILGDSYCELLGVVISSLLAHFLAVGDLKGKLELDGWSYMLSNQFPAVILWHTMITGAYWFMKSGMEDCEDAVNTCAQTIAELEII
jgi:hypothetical protein